MKKIFIPVLIAMLALPLLFSSCKKDIDYPSVNYVDGIDVTIPRIILEGGKLQVFISVTDLEGNAITDLNSSNLYIESIKDGIVTPITGFNLYSTNNQPTPICAALTMDYSGSMYYDSAAVPSMETAVKTFIALKAATDLIEIIKFDNNVQVIQGFTVDTTLLYNAVDDTVFTFMGSTAFYQACLTGIEDADSVAFHHPLMLPAVVGFTDGLNNQPPLNADTVYNYALQQQIPVYTIGYGSTPDTATLRLIADTTGGRFYWSPGPTDLLQLYQYVNGQLTNAIVVGFPWGNKANATIRVTVNYMGHQAKAEKMIWY